MHNIFGVCYKNYVHFCTYGHILLKIALHCPIRTVRKTASQSLIRAVRKIEGGKLIMNQMPKEWEGFKGGHWTKEINVREFIQKNYTPYDGDESFRAGPTEAAKKL